MVLNYSVRWLQDHSKWARAFLLLCFSSHDSHQVKWLSSPSTTSFWQWEGDISLWAAIGMGFPGSSKSACNTGDPSSIPGSGRVPGKRIHYPLQYSWASLVAQTIKNLPVMWKNWVQFLGGSPGGGHGNPLQ